MTIKPGRKSAIDQILNGPTHQLCQATWRDLCRELRDEVRRLVREPFRACSCNDCARLGVTSTIMAGDDCPVCAMRRERYTMHDTLTRAQARGTELLERARKSEHAHVEDTAKLTIRTRRLKNAIVRVCKRRDVAQAEAANMRLAAGLNEDTVRDWDPVVKAARDHVCDHDIERGPLHHAVAGLKFSPSRGQPNEPASDQTGAGVGAVVPESADKTLRPAHGMFAKHPAAEAEGVPAELLAETSNEDQERIRRALAPAVVAARGSDDELTLEREAGLRESVKRWQREEPVVQRAVFNTLENYARPSPGIGTRPGVTGAYALAYDCLEWLDRSVILDRGKVVELVWAAKYLDEYGWNGEKGLAVGAVIEAAATVAAELEG